MLIEYKELTFLQGIVKLYPDFEKVLYSSPNDYNSNDYHAELENIFILIYKVIMQKVKLILESEGLNELALGLYNIINNKEFNTLLNALELSRVDLSYY